jgi:hypothetical protein
VLAQQISHAESGHCGAVAVGEDGPIGRVLIARVVALEEIAQ